MAGRYTVFPVGKLLKKLIITGDHIPTNCVYSAQKTQSTIMAYWDFADIKLIMTLTPGGVNTVFCKSIRSIFDRIDPPAAHHDILLDVFTGIRIYSV